jgi:hypothetical protein
MNLIKMNQNHNLKTIFAIFSIPFFGSKILIDKFNLVGYTYLSDQIDFDYNSNCDFLNI